MKATTNNRLNLDTLIAHLGVESLIVSGDPDSVGPKEIEADTPDLESKLATYVYSDPPEQLAESSITDEAEQALVSLRNLANGNTAMTAAQLTGAMRGMARVLIVLVRLQLSKFEGTN